MSHSHVCRQSLLALVMSAAACGGDCVSVGVSRLSITERTLQVGDSFVASYEEGGVCGADFTPTVGRVTWTTAERDILQVDSLSGTVTARRAGDALVVPSVPVTTGAQSILVHVRN